MNKKILSARNKKVLIIALSLLVLLTSVIATRQYSKQRFEGAVTDSYAVMLAGAEEQLLDFQKHGEQNTYWGGAADFRAAVYMILKVGDDTAIYKEHDVLMAVDNLLFHEPDWLQAHIDDLLKALTVINENPGFRGSYDALRSFYNLFDKA